MGHEWSGVRRLLRGAPAILAFACAAASAQVPREVVIREYRFEPAEVKVQAGGRGVTLIALEEGETLAAVAVPADDAVLTVEGSGRGAKPVVHKLKPAQLVPLRHRRARKGMALTPRIKPERMG